MKAAAVRPVLDSLGQVDLQIESLSKMVSLLEDRLGPLAQPRDTAPSEFPSPAEPGAMDVPRPRSDVTVRVDRQSVEIGRQSDRIGTLLAYLDL